MAKRKQQKQAEGLSFGVVLVGIFVGALVGALAGASAMLLMAPRSGKKTRAKIEKKGKQLRQQATHTLEDGVDQVHTKANQVSARLHKQVDNLQQRGHDAVEHQKERWTPVLEEGKAAINSS